MTDGTTPNPRDASVPDAAPGLPSGAVPGRVRLPHGRVLRRYLSEGVGPEVVFTPGNGFSAETYGPALAGLPATVRLHAVNPAGMGGSDAPEPFTDWLGFVADLQAYVEAECRAPAVLVGHSFGAVLSMALAARAPHLVRGLVLLEPLVRGARGENWNGGPNPEGRAMPERARARRERWESRAEAVETLRPRGIYAGWAEAPWAAWAASALLDDGQSGVRLACAPWQEAAIYETVPDSTTFFAWVDAVRAPGALVRAAETNVVSARGIAQLADALPVGVVYTAAGTHSFPMERPEATGALLAEGLAFVLRSPCVPPAGPHPTAG